MLTLPSMQSDFPELYLCSKNMILIFVHFFLGHPVCTPFFSDTIIVSLLVHTSIVCSVPTSWFILISAHFYLFCVALVSVCCTARVSFSLLDYLYSINLPPVIRQVFISIKCNEEILKSCSGMKVAHFQ